MTTTLLHDEHSGGMAALCRHLIADPAQEWIRADDDDDEGDEDDEGDDCEEDAPASSRASNVDLDLL